MMILRCCENKVVRASGMRDESVPSGPQAHRSAAICAAGDDPAPVSEQTLKTLRDEGWRGNVGAKTDDATQVLKEPPMEVFGFTGTIGTLRPRSSVG